MRRSYNDRTRINILWSCKVLVWKKNYATLKHNHKSDKSERKLREEEGEGVGEREQKEEEQEQEEQDEEGLCTKQTGVKNTTIQEYIKFVKAARKARAIYASHLCYNLQLHKYITEEKTDKTGNNTRETEHHASIIV